MNEHEAHDNETLALAPTQPPPAVRQHRLRWLGTVEAQTQLQAAWAAANCEFPELVKSRHGKVTLKDNKGSYEHDWVTLADLDTCVRAALGRHGLVFSQPYYDDDSGVHLVSTLAGFGARVEAEISFAYAEKIQDLGSLLTYHQRYAMGAFLRLAAENDDDGNKAFGNKVEITDTRRAPQAPTKQVQSAPTKPAQPSGVKPSEPPTAPADPNGMVQPDTLKAILAIHGQLGLRPPKISALTQEAFGGSVDDFQRQGGQAKAETYLAHLQGLVAAIGGVS